MVLILYALFKALVLPPVCIKYTVRDESRVAIYIYVSQTLIILISYIRTLFTLT